MSSLREQALAQVLATLTAAQPGGATVTRSRATSITRAQAPTIIVSPAQGDATRLATQVDKTQMEVRLAIFVRGDPWDSLADPIDVAAHKALLGSTALRNIVADVRRISENFEDQEADRTAGTLTVTYRLTWLANAADISASA